MGMFKRRAKRVGNVMPLGRRGWGPSPGALAITMLTGGRGARASGRAEARPHARALRGSRLDVHTELPMFVYSEIVSTYIQNWQLLVYKKSSRGTYIDNCLCMWEPFWDPQKKSTHTPCCSYAHNQFMILYIFIHIY